MRSATLERPVHRRPSDARIVAGLRDRDAGALEELNATYGRLIASWACSAGNDVEDVVQDVLFRVWRAGPRLDPDTTLPPYLKTLTANTLRDRWRAAGRKPVVPVGLEPSGAASDPTASENSRIALEQILSTLADRERNVLEMMYLSDLSLEETATKLGVSQEATKSLAARARRRLRDQLIKLVATSPAATLALLVGRAAEALQGAGTAIAVAAAAASAVGAVAISAQRTIDPSSSAAAVATVAAPSPVVVEAGAPRRPVSVDEQPAALAQPAAIAEPPAEPAPPAGNNASPAPTTGPQGSTIADADDQQPSHGTSSGPPDHPDCSPPPSGGNTAAPTPTPAPRTIGSPTPAPACSPAGPSNAGHTSTAPGGSGGNGTSGTAPTGSGGSPQSSGNPPRGNRGTNGTSIG